MSRSNSEQYFLFDSECEVEISFDLTGLTSGLEYEDVICGEYLIYNNQGRLYNIVIVNGAMDVIARDINIDGFHQNMIKALKLYHANMDYSKCSTAELMHLVSLLAQGNDTTAVRSKNGCIGVYAIILIIMIIVRRAL